MVDTPSQYIRSTKKAMTYASQEVISSKLRLKEQSQQTNNQIQNVSSKTLNTKVEFNSTITNLQQSQKEYMKLKYLRQKSLKALEQNKEKRVQNSPLFFYLQDSKQQQDDLEMPQQKFSLDQIQESTQIDFRKFYKNEKVAQTSSLQRQKKPFNKQNLLEQIVSYGLDNKNSFDHQKEINKIKKPSLKLEQINKSNNNSTNKFLSKDASPFKKILGISPFQNQHFIQQTTLQKLIPDSQFQKKFVSFKIKSDQTEKIEPVNQIRLEKTTSFTEIKDKIFQINRLFQEKVDQEFSQKDSCMLKLLVLKGFKPQNLCFYFSKLIENILNNCTYPQQQQPINLQKQQKIFSRKNSINLENQEDLEKTQHNNNQTNNNNNNTTNLSTASKLTNYFTTNASTEKDLHSYSSINLNNNNKLSSTSKRVQSHKSKVEECSIQVHSLAHISSNIVEDVQFKSQPQIYLNRDKLWITQQFTNSLDEIMYDEDDDQKDVDGRDNNQNEKIKEEFFVDLEKNKNQQDLNQQSLSFNLFFKIPSQIYDELIQFLSIILKDNINNFQEINYLIKYLNDHKKEYTPQNLAEEFGSIERILITSKLLLSKLVNENLLLQQIQDHSKEEDILNFVNCLLNSDQIQLKHYSGLLNANTRISFAEFYLFKQIIHKQLSQILDADEKISLLPQIMEQIEKSRNIFLVQRENQLDDSSLIDKIISEIKMKMYVKCSFHIFETYFIEKMNPFVNQNESGSTLNQQLNQFNKQNNSYQFLYNIQQLSYRHQKFENNQKKKFTINSARKENFHAHDYLIFTPKNKTNIKIYPKNSFSSHNRFSVISELFSSTLQKTQQDNLISPKHENHKNVNKAIQISYFEDLTSFILENIILQQNLTNLINGLKQKLSKLDLKILNFLESVFVEILKDNYLQSELIYDIKIRFLKIKFSLIENFKIKYESDDFRQILFNNFSYIFEKNLQTNNIKLCHTKFFSTFDYIIYYYLSLSDIFSSFDFNFAIFIADSKENIIQQFKKSVKETFKVTLPSQIINLIDFENLFLQ